jgi:hypothetical protein
MKRKETNPQGCGPEEEDGLEIRPTARAIGLILHRPRPTGTAEPEVGPPRRVPWELDAGVMPRIQFGRWPEKNKVDLLGARPQGSVLSYVRILRVVRVAPANPAFRVPNKGQIPA